MILLMLKLDLSDVGSVEIDFTEFARDIIYTGWTMKQVVKGVSFKRILILFQIVQREF